MKKTRKPNKNNNRAPRFLEYESKDSSAPIAISRLVKQGTPSISTRGGDIVIRHRELMLDISTSGGGELVRTYTEANPGLYTSFPWLSRIASRFESYTFTYLAYEYVPMCSSTTPGCLTIGPDYDVSDYIPEDIITVSSFPNAVRTSLWQPCKMVCDPRLLTKLVKERMVRSDDVDAVDMKLYDAACTYFFTYGSNASTVVGSMWVEYEIVLRTPSMDTSVGDEASAKLVAGGVVSKASPLGANPIAYNGAAGTPIIEAINDTTFRIKRPGEFLFNWNFTGTGLDGSAPALTFASALDGMLTAASVGLPNAAQTAEWVDSWLHVLRPCVVTLVSSAAWTTVTGCVLRAAPYKGVLF